MPWLQENLDLLDPEGERTRQESISINGKDLCLLPDNRSEWYTPLMKMPARISCLRSSKSIILS